MDEKEDDGGSNECMSSRFRTCHRESRSHEYAEFDIRSAHGISFRKTQQYQQGSGWIRADYDSIEPRLSSTTWKDGPKQAH